VVCSCENTVDQNSPESNNLAAADYDELDSTELLSEINKIDSNRVKDILERNDFFLREGDYLLIDKVIEKGQLISSERYCQNEWETDDRCVTIHHYETNARSLSSAQLSLLNRTVIYGNESVSFKRAKTHSFRTLNEELSDSLKGIWLPEEMCEPTYYWVGEQAKYSLDHSVITMNTNQSFSGGFQWAILGETDPIIYRKADLEKEERRAIYNDLVEQEFYEYGSGVLLFSHDKLELIVTYNIYDECGYEYYENIKLWNSTPDAYTLIKDLEKVPLMIFDIDADQDIDILFESENLHDSHDFIEIDYPSCEINGTDTSYICGC
jgi:hypothetical protein